MDELSRIKQPIEAEFSEFIGLFNQSLTHDDGMLGQALQHIRQRTGKQMRPILMLLLAKNFGGVSLATYHAAVALELLHTASLIHDDVVDDSFERRGQASVNASFNNKVAVLVGDYVLSTALLHVSHTHSEEIVRMTAQLGKTLSNGEIMQMSNIHQDEISEKRYYEVIRRKTAALFETCCAVAALSVGADKKVVDAAKTFGQQLGMIFQIRDDIFDYGDGSDIGKPIGNDMREGKLTLPAIYALKSTQNESMKPLVRKVKNGTITDDEIAFLMQFTKESGGIVYAERRMWEFHHAAQSFIEDYVHDASIKNSLRSYLDFIILRHL